MPARTGKSPIVRVIAAGPTQRPAELLEPAFRPPEHPKAAQLRKRYRLKSVAGEGTDFECARRIKMWARSRWNHGYDQIQGSDDALRLLAAAATGLNFACGSYARTFVQCSLAAGLPARVVGIHRKEVDFPHGYAGNSGHTVAEVYCREPAKWVLMDTDANCFYTINDTPAGALDLHRAWHERRGENVRQVLDEPLFVPIYESGYALDATTPYPLG